MPSPFSPYEDSPEAKVINAEVEKKDLEHFYAISSIKVRDKKKFLEGGYCQIEWNKRKLIMKNFKLD